MARLLILPEFIAAAARESFAWGERDCAMFVADWVHRVTGRDPAADLRGTYRGRVGADRVARRGIVSIVARRARDAGFERTRDPVAGDIGIVTDALGTTYCAVRTATGWVARLERGIVVASVNAVHLRAAWRVV